MCVYLSGLVQTDDDDELSTRHKQTPLTYLSLNIPIGTVIVNGL